MGRATLGTGHRSQHPVAEQRDASEGLVTRLADVGYLDPAIPLDQLDETLAEGLTVRVAADGHYVPNVELKFATDQYSCASLVDPVTVRLSDGDLLIDSLELQIAYKLWMGAQKDFEDALYLYHLLGSTVNTAQVEPYAVTLGVTDKYDQLRSR